MKFIRTGGHSGAVFNRLASINHRNSCFLLFSVIVASPHLVHRRPFAVSRPPSIRPLFPSPKRVPRLFLPPKICTIQIKRRRLRSAYQCCFYRIGARQTSARFTLLPPPFFFELLCFIRGTGTARIHVAGDVISDCCAFRSITGD